jgi:arginyl-tRNA synthetase
VIDYGSPNVAKEMHVGHVRTMVIGDAIARVLEFSGHRVIRQNHIGDWGTPFGMLIEHLIDRGGAAAASELSVGELNEFYRAARDKFDTDSGFAERARGRVVLLQGGDADTLALWRTLVDASTQYFSRVFQRLGVQLTEKDIRGESFYNPSLVAVADDLSRRGLAVTSEGALCVFVDGFKTREGQPLPLIVRKNDGGFGYAATDLAALRFRSHDLCGTRLIYVVGSPQRQHLAMVFDVGRRAGYLREGAHAEHVAFGSILGPDRKMFKTRSGESVRLTDLLNEGEERALATVSERNPDLDLETRRNLARQISLGAIKYADLSNDRIKDYILDWTQMLAFEGNTGPYLQYAHARIRAIFRKLDSNVRISPDAFRIEHPSEKALGLVLCGFDAAVRSVAHGLEPHKLCSYLYELASSFTAFYEACPVLRAESSEVRGSRLALADLTARILARGLNLLGIDVPDRM